MPSSITTNPASRRTTPRLQPQVDVAAALDFYRKNIKMDGGTDRRYGISGSELPPSSHKLFDELKHYFGHLTSARYYPQAYRVPLPNGQTTYAVELPSTEGSFAFLLDQNGRIFAEGKQSEWNGPWTYKASNDQDPMKDWRERIGDLEMRAVYSDWAHPPPQILEKPSRGAFSLPSPIYKGEQNLKDFKERFSGEALTYNNGRGSKVISKALGIPETTLVETNSFQSAVKLDAKVERNVHRAAMEYLDQLYGRDQGIGISSQTRKALYDQKTGNLVGFFYELSTYGDMDREPGSHGRYPGGAFRPVGVLLRPNGEIAGIYHGGIDDIEIDSKTLDGYGYARPFDIDSYNRTIAGGSSSFASTSFVNPWLFWNPFFWFAGK